MKDINSMLEVLEAGGCTVRTTHTRPIVECLPGAHKQDKKDERYLPDGSYLVVYGTKNQLQRYKEAGYKYVNFHDKGGQTHVLIETPDGGVFRGTALCQPEHWDDNGKLVPGDQYNRRLGRRIALGRAVKSLEIDTQVVASPANPSWSPAVPENSSLSNMLAELLEENGFPGDAEPDEIVLGDGLVVRFWI